MRGENLLYVKGNRSKEDLDDVSRKNLAAQPQSGTSIFDPVICELIYKWFCPANGLVLDCFAGGSVRGIVAAKLGLNYIGIELREEQVAANKEQAQEICKDGACPAWVQGDAKECKKIAPGEYDFLFTCPPYYDLEEYSDLPQDLSSMSDAEFEASLASILLDACSMLKPDCFAAIVVGDCRDKKGYLRNFPGKVVQYFEAAGLRFYNEAIIVNAIGSLPIRAGRSFAKNRKLGRCHQNVLVFVKGDFAAAAAKCQEYEFKAEVEDSIYG